MVKCASESLGMPASRSRKTRAGIWRRYLPTAAGSLMYDRGKVTADRQDGAACARQGRSSFLPVSPAASLCIMDGVRTPTVEPSTTRPRRIRIASRSSHADLARQLSEYP